MRPFQALLFDCDGVLVDSEPITNAVLCEMLGELGWPLSLQECAVIFTGKGVLQEQARIEARIGRPLPEGWVERFRHRRNQQLLESVEAIPHALEVVEKLHARYEGRIALVSGALRPKVMLQLARCGLARYFEGRIFTGEDCARPKPDPGGYLLAAAALGVPPAACAVVEDTVTGVVAGAASGATVIGYHPESEAPPDALRAAGATRVIADLRELLAIA